MVFSALPVPNKVTQRTEVSKFKRLSDFIRLCRKKLPPTSHLSAAHPERRVYSVSQKSSPLKLFAVFSFLVNLCN